MSCHRRPTPTPPTTRSRLQHTGHHASLHMPPLGPPNETLFQVAYLGRDQPTPATRSSGTRDSARSCGLWWQPRPHARALPATFRLAFQAHQGHHWQPLCLRFFAIVLCHTGSPQKCPFFSQPFCDMRQLFLEPRHHTSTPSTRQSTAQFAWVVLATPSKAPIYPIKSPTLACDTRRAAPTYSQPDVRPTVVFLQTK